MDRGQRGRLGRLDRPNLSQDRQTVDLFLAFLGEVDTFELVAHPHMVTPAAAGFKARRNFSASGGVIEGVHKATARPGQAGGGNSTKQ
jgi:hypothetical protein